MTWADAWNGASYPDELRSIRVMEWDDFVAGVEMAEDYFVQTIVNSILFGDAWILKHAFTPEFLHSAKIRTIAWMKDRPSEFHKILDGAPDFQRQIDLETGKKYSVAGCRQSAYFFRWNDDPLNLWPEVTKCWRVLKTAMGMRYDEYEANKPSDGPTDRLQIARYLPSNGYLEPHRDSAAHQPCFISVYMSRRGRDYTGGGFYFVQDGEARYAEDEIDVGDICIGHANLLHGVAPCDGEPSWDKTDGRWWMGLYSNASDYGTRATSMPEKVQIKGVMPSEI